MSKLGRSYELFRIGLVVLKQNKKLLLFPFVNVLLLGVIAMFFILPIALFPTGHSFTEPAHWKALTAYFGSMQNNKFEFNRQPGPEVYVLFCTLYLLSVFLATFFNVAFYNEILNALNGRPVSIRGGLRFACTRLKPILAWSLIAGSVGVIIKLLEEQVGWIGKLVLKLVGVTWSVASIFAIPIIIRDRQSNPLQVLGVSAKLVRKTWGETVFGYAGIAFGSAIMLITSLGLLSGSIVLSIVYASAWFFLVGFVLCITILVMGSYLLNLANSIYRAALYIYATEGVTPAPFTDEQMNAAWRVKTARTT